MPINTPPQRRTCTQCHKDKPIECFPVHGRARSGRLSTCADCTRTNATQRQQAARGRVSSSVRKLEARREAEEQAARERDAQVADLLRSHREAAGGLR